MTRRTSSRRGSRSSPRRCVHTHSRAPLKRSLKPALRRRLLPSPSASHTAVLPHTSTKTHPPPLNATPRHAGRNRRGHRWRRASRYDPISTAPLADIWIIEGKRAASKFKVFCRLIVNAASLRELTNPHLTLTYPTQQAASLATPSAL